MSAPGTWRTGTETGSAAELHRRSGEGVGADAPPPHRRATVLLADRPAVVLGSAQPGSDVDVAAARAVGIDVVRRRSGGGAVLVDREDLVWVDLVVPLGDPLWEADVGRATFWLGECWAGAVTDVTGLAAETWKGGLVTTRWSKRICFAGMGPGEVMVDGRKVVGISQRRTRRAALFQTAVLLRWRPERLVGLLELPPRERSEVLSDVADVAMGLGSAAAPGLVAALLGRLDALAGSFRS